MYEIRSDSVKTFITDKSVKLPRFQRKQTWKEIKNFQLCISVFNNYPLGMCIISEEFRKGKNVRMLLDGRQRRNALLQMYEDPEKIYLWAIKFIGIKNSDQLADIEEKFNAKISEYIEADFDEEVQTQDTNGIDDSIVDEVDETEEDIEPVGSGLDLLLQIIKVCHNKYTKGTGFARPFDLTKYVQKLPYQENDNGKIKLSSKRIKTFISEYETYCEEHELEQDNVDSFRKYIISRCNIESGKEDKFKEELKKQWPLILERIQIVDSIDSTLSRSYVGIIDVKNPTPSDAQKIFNIINTGGEKLSAVEILSAKPHWNLIVDNPSETALEYIRKLYKRIGVESDNTVRWDYPATFYRRLGKNIVFPQMDEKDDNLGRELTLGFKMISAIKVGGIKKEDIEELGKKAEVNWAIDIDKLVSDLSLMNKVITSFSYFKCLDSWHNTILGLSSESAAINFITLAYLDWVRKNRPLGNETRGKQFQKNCFIILDQTIFEYVNKQWKGSADQKTANNISEFSNKPDMLKPVEKDKWLRLLEEIFDENSIDGVAITKDYMTPLLYHMYCMRNIYGPSTDCEVEVDHILPVSLFASSSIENKNVIQHNLLNLGLLPKKDNINKSNNKLKQIDDSWLIHQIEIYEFVEQKDFDKYSNISNYKDLFKMRREVFIDTFMNKREDLLNN